MFKTCENSIIKHNGLTADELLSNDFGLAQQLATVQGG